VLLAVRRRWWAVPIVFVLFVSFGIWRTLREPHTLPRGNDGSHRECDVADRRRADERADLRLSDRPDGLGAAGNQEPHGAERRRNALDCGCGS
jgi:hypothetical protein